MQLWTWQTGPKQNPERNPEGNPERNPEGKTHKPSNRPFLTCSLLPQPHGFFTQQFSPTPPESLLPTIVPISAQALAARVYRVKQVHSGDVLLPSEIEAAVAAGLPNLEDGTPAPFPLADGIVTEQPQQAVWACSADCTPALIGDVVTGQVAAVHAGWRGTAQKILPTAVARLQAQGSQLKDLRIALGPAIDGRVYQVGKDVAAKVGLTVASQLDLEPDDEALLEALMALENPPIFRDPDTSKVRLDVRQINRMQLEQMGIDAVQIAIAPHCTYQEPEHFFSYRRTREKKVQWSGIVSS
ncbi:MAG: peptidoglycan editing factor PgeF [Phormidesmis sp. RL_2_1]|nr:peptidoglycan editing factor PgeF [Phormidesmis sp. RL_2_1]